MPATTSHREKNVRTSFLLPAMNGRRTSLAASPSDAQNLPAGPSRHSPDPSSFGEALTAHGQHTGRYENQHDSHASVAYLRRRGRTPLDPPRVNPDAHPARI